jgi:hypothetical protein
MAEKLIDGRPLATLWCRFQSAAVQSLRMFAVGRQYCADEHNGVTLEDMSNVSEELTRPTFTNATPSVGGKSK